MIVAIDESNSSTGAGLYVLAAVVVPQAAAGSMRRSLRALLLRALLLPRQQRLPWTKESQRRRLQILTPLTEANAEPCVYVARAPWRKHESARGRSLALILRNHCATAAEVIIESREHIVTSTTTGDRASPPGSDPPTGQ